MCLFAALVAMVSFAGCWWLRWWVCKLLVEFGGFDYVLYFSFWFTGWLIAVVAIIGFIAGLVDFVFGFTVV